MALNNNKFLLLELGVNQWAGLLTKFQVDWWAGSPSEAQLHQCATKITALVSGQPVGSIASSKQGGPVGRVACRASPNWVNQWAGSLPKLQVDQSEWAGLSSEGQVDRWAETLHFPSEFPLGLSPWTSPWTSLLHFPSGLLKFKFPSGLSPQIFSLQNH